MSITYILFVALELFNIAASQVSGLGPYGCQVESGISVLPACDSLNATLHSCFDNVEKPASNQSCFCQQGVLNSVFECESEFRLCYQNYRFDYYPQSIVKNWHDQCDDYVSFTPTTPVLSNPTTTRPTIVGGTLQAICTDLLTSCAILSSAEAQCWALDHDLTASSALNCACSTSLLSLASVCLYDANITCLGTDAHLSDISLFNICSQTYSNGQIVMADTTRGAVTETSTTATPRTVPSSTVASTSVSSQVASITPSATQSAVSTLPSTGSAGPRPIDFDGYGTAIFLIAIFNMIWGAT